MTFRKLVILLALALVFTVSFSQPLSAWLADVGAVDAANMIRRECLTGAAVAVIAVVLVVTPSGAPARGSRDRWPFE